jgi:hypothetical protein
VHGVDFQSGAPAVDDTWVYVSTPFGPQPFQWQHSKLKTSQVQNDSTVTGTNADDALEHLDSSKQATLISGTNIKTVNSTSLLGSGNLAVGTFNLPALTSGSVLFSNGTTIAQDNANLFFDDTNNRLGIGTTTPSVALTIFGTNELLQIGDGSAANSSYISFNGTRSQIGYKSNGLHLLTSTGRSLVFGSGTFASTTAWGVFFGTTGNLGINTITDAGFKLDVNGTARIVGALRADNTLLVNGTSINGSAIAQFDSGTRGFLPPRMTSTQKNAIATPAAGLVVYDTTLGKLCVRGAAAWETITSL